eukprot:COSAG01_NODE_36680_length_513_cov_127.248792_1_plen_42_part_10
MRSAGAGGENGAGKILCEDVGKSQSVLIRIEPMFGNCHASFK